MISLNYLTHELTELILIIKEKHAVVINGLNSLQMDDFIVLGTFALVDFHLHYYARANATI